MLSSQRKYTFHARILRYTRTCTQMCPTYTQPDIHTRTHTYICTSELDRGREHNDSTLQIALLSPRPCLSTASSSQYSLSGPNPSTPSPPFLLLLLSISPPPSSLLTSCPPLAAHTTTGPKLLARHRCSSLAASSSRRVLTKCCNHKKEVNTLAI